VIIIFLIAPCRTAVVVAPPEAQCGSSITAGRLPGDRSRQLSIGGGFLILWLVHAVGSERAGRLSTDFNSLHSFAPYSLHSRPLRRSFPFIAAAVLAHLRFVSIIDDLGVFCPKCFTPGVDFHSSKNGSTFRRQFVFKFGALTNESFRCRQMT
jgi:hypothetical protein